MGLVGFQLQAAICAASGFAFLLFGYDQGVMGGLVALPSFLGRFGNPNPTFLGFMVASYDVGALFGAIGAFIYGDIVGRRWAIVIGCLILCVGATLQTSAFSSAQFIVGRIVAGLGVGGISVTVPVYASECVKAHRRGLMVVIQISLVVLGIVLSAFTNFGLLYGNSTWQGKEAQWRIPIGLQMMFPIVVFALLPLCVESPRWLAIRGRYDEVAGVLARLEGKGATATSPHILTVSEEIIAIATHEAAMEASWTEVFSMDDLQNFRRITLSFAMGLMQQLTGMNCIVYYAAVVFQQVGLSARLSYIMSCVASIAMLLGSVSAAAVIDRVGRRKVIMFGAWTVATFMGGLAASIGYGTTHPASKKSAGWAATAFIFLIEFFFGFGFLCVPWLYGSEVNSLRMRNKGAAMQCAANWGITILTVMVAPVGFANIGWKFYLVWMSITYSTIPLLYFCYPETAGRTLEQMDYFFAKYQQWDIHRVAYEQVDREDTVMAVVEKPKGDHVEIEEHTA